MYQIGFLGGSIRETFEPLGFHENQINRVVQEILNPPEMIEKKNKERKKNKVWESLQECIEKCMPSAPFLKEFIQLERIIRKTKENPLKSTTVRKLIPKYLHSKPPVSLIYMNYGNGLQTPLVLVKWHTLLKLNVINGIMFASM